jgi:hypothetical protein
MTQLSEHFSLEEATFSSTAIRNGISNQPNEDQLANMQATAAGMEQIRAILDKPIHIDSWLRVQALNTAVGGVGHSAHMDGFAVDFICPDYGTPIEIATALAKTDLKVDQIIQEGNWVHVSFAPAMRQQLLTAHFVPGKPTTYTVGVA